MRAPLDLGPENPFSDEELATNRAGKLHPAQRARLEARLADVERHTRLGRILAMSFLVGSMVIAALMVAFSHAPTAAVRSTAVMVVLSGIGLAFVPGAVAAVGRMSSNTRRMALDAQVVTAFDGPLIKRVIEARERPIYRVEIGPTFVDTRRAVWEALPDDEPPARAYALTPGRYFLSAEWR